MNWLYIISGLIAAGLLIYLFIVSIKAGDVRMTLNGILQIAFYLVVLVLAVKPLGIFMARVYQRERTFLDPIFGPLERFIYRLAGINPDEEFDWKENAIAMLVFNFAGLLVVYALQRLQQFFPLNPQGMTAVSPDSSFNTAVSFATNTNWQGRRWPCWCSASCRSPGNGCGLAPKRGRSVPTASCSPIPAGGAIPWSG